MLPSFLQPAINAGINTLAQSTLGDIFGNIFGGERGRTQQGQGTAVERSTQTLPQETQASGTSGTDQVSAPIFAPQIEIGTPTSGMGGQLQQAALGPFGGAAVSLGKKYLPEIFGGVLGGAAIGLAPTIMDNFGQPKKLRVTRKLKAQVKKAVELMGIEATAQAMGVDVNTVLFILMKKMRNDGPYVTKAAVRKTRQTVRKMKTLCDMYDDLRPAAKRRPPMRRAATTRITQVK